MSRQERGTALQEAPTSAEAPASRDRTEESRSARKRLVILDAARSLFLRHGYLGTSMDDIAARAQVSKQTVYKHFGDKRRMFVELLTADMGNSDASVAAVAAIVPDSDDLENDLRAFARAYLAAIMQPHLIRLRRIVIGEAERFPELAAAWYASGPARSYSTFATWFEVLNRRGLLQVQDPLLAAQTFNWLVLSVPLNEAMSRPVDDAFLDAHRLDHYADEGVRVFLAAYRGNAAATDPPA